MEWVLVPTPKHGGEWFRAALAALEVSSLKQNSSLKEFFTILSKKKTYDDENIISNPSHTVAPDRSHSATAHRNFAENSTNRSWG